MPSASYAIALGSNRRTRHGAPVATVRAAAAQLGASRLSRIHQTAALGPAGRRFANAAAILTSDMAPLALLRRLKSIERQFGRRGGRRWGPRALDLDIILWSGGRHDHGGLTIPHPAFRTRRFVLDPLAEIAAGRRDPVTGRTIAQLAHRLRRARPVDRPRARA